VKHAKRDNQEVVWAARAQQIWHGTLVPRGAALVLLSGFERQVEKTAEEKTAPIQGERNKTSQEPPVPDLAPCGAYSRSLATHGLQKSTEPEAETNRVKKRTTRRDDRLLTITPQVRRRQSINTPFGLIENLHERGKNVRGGRADYELSKEKKQKLRVRRAAPA